MYELTFTDTKRYLDHVGVVSEKALVPMIQAMLKAGLMLSGIELLSTDTAEGGTSHA